MFFWCLWVLAALIIFFENQNILYIYMIDRVLNMGVANQECYYFQLIPLSLSIINRESELPVQGTTYRFTISKGQQKFDQNKIPISANFQSAGNLPVLVINSCRLHFYIPSYIKQRKQDFSLTLVQRQNNEDYDLGEFKINVDDLIIQFKENNIIRHELKNKFTDDYELDFEIYIEKNRMALQKHIRENKVERINKSPLRQRSSDKNQTPKREFNNSGKKPVNDKNAENTPSRDKEEPKTGKTQASKPKPEVPVEVKVTEVEQAPQVPQVPQTSQRIEIGEDQESKETPIQAVREHSQKISYKASQKNEGASQKSKDKVPLIQTKYQPLKYEGDGVGEVKMKESQRVGGSSAKPQETHAKKSSDQMSTQQKISLAIFLLVSLVIMYFAMHPNRKV